MILTTVYFFLTFCFFLFFNKFSSLVNIYDIPNERKFHKNEISLAGGIYIFICIYSYLLATTVFNLNNTEIFFSITTENFNFFIIAFLFFFVGFVDDKKNISSNSKIIIFFILTLVVVSIDPRLNVKILRFSFIENKILLQNFSVIFTIFSIFIFINSLNMYDGSNGQLGTYAVIFISYLFYKSNSFLILNLIIPIVFFLYLNLKNKTFAGNSGSYFLGFFLSYIILKIYNFEKDSYMYSDEVVLLMFYPVVELIRLFFSRIYNNKNPFYADRNHIHHILQNMQYSNKKIQLILFTINALPLIIYEFTKINILVFFVINIIVYYLIISNKLFFQNNKH